MSKVVQNIRIPTNNQKDSVCRINVEAVTFSDLWTSYPGGHPYKDPKTGMPPKGYEDQCAINLSAAIHGTGITVDEKRTAIRAQEVAAWFKLQPFCGLRQHPQNVTGVYWDEKIKGITGIVFFADYWKRANEKAASGDHIDLWDGSRLTAVGLSFFSTLGRRLGVNEVFPGTSYGIQTFANRR